MLLGEASAEYFYEATLYYAASDGVSLSQATRTLLVQSGEALIDVVLRRPARSHRRRGAGQRGPGRYAGDLPRSLGRSGDGGSFHRRPQCAERTGTSGACTWPSPARCLELEGIEGVNVLIGGREEGLLGLPCGVFTEVETDVTAVWAQMQAESDRYQGNARGAATRTAALYFPSTDGQWLLPEAREITFTRGDRRRFPRRSALRRPDGAHLRARRFAHGRAAGRRTGARRHRRGRAHIASQFERRDRSRRRRLPACKPGRSAAR